MSSTHHSRTCKAMYGVDQAEGMAASSLAVEAATCLPYPLYVLGVLCFSFPCNVSEAARCSKSDLELARIDDGGGALDGTGRASELLNSLDNLLSLLVGDLSEDNVAAVEPLGLHSGDEELRTVAICGDRVLVKIGR